MDTVDVVLSVKVVETVKVGVTVGVNGKSSSLYIILVLASTQENNTFDIFTIISGTTESAAAVDITFVIIGQFAPIVFDL